MNHRLIHYLAILLILILAYRSIYILPWAGGGYLMGYVVGWWRGSHPENQEHQENQ